MSKQRTSRMGQEVEDSGDPPGSGGENWQSWVTLLLKMTQHPKFQTTSDGTLLLNFGQYGQEVEVAAISGDGRRILTVRDVGKGEVRDAVSGSKVGEIQPDSPLQGTTDTALPTGTFEVFIESAALNRDGSTALLGLNDGTAGTFRVGDGVRLARLHPPDEEPATQFGVIGAVAYSPDGSLQCWFEARGSSVRAGHSREHCCCIERQSAGLRWMRGQDSHRVGSPNRGDHFRGARAWSRS
jgi:hypothetical protein